MGAMPLQRYFQNYYIMSSGMMIVSRVGAVFFVDILFKKYILANSDCPVYHWLEVSCCPINYWLEVSREMNIMSSNYQQEIISVLTNKKRRKSKCMLQIFFSFLPLHEEISLTIWIVIEAFTCNSYILMQENDDVAQSNVVEMK